MMEQAWWQKENSFLLPMHNRAASLSPVTYEMDVARGKYYWKVQPAAPMVH